MTPCPPAPTRIQHYMTMRAFTIRYLRMIEDELVATGAIQAHDRACLTRAERRALIHRHATGETNERPTGDQPAD